MSEQKENDLICARLLEWHPDDGGWIKSDGYMYGGCGTPAFTTWAEAGLILDALAAQWPKTKAALRGLGGSMVLGGLTPPEVRECALEYLAQARQAERSGKRCTDGDWIGDQEPGGMDCEDCGCIFISNDGRPFCKVCHDARASEQANGEQV